MQAYAKIVIKHKKTLVFVFIMLAVMGALAGGLVTVNYNMADYLPKDAQSTTALDTLREEFDQGLPNASVMVRDVSVSEAMLLKERLSAASGVEEVTWLDDVLGRDILTSVPVEYLDRAVVESYYKDGAALFSLVIQSGHEKTALNEIRSLIGEKNALSGDAVDAAELQSLARSEVFKAFAILIPVILLILIWSTTSWLEPLLFLMAIGVAVLINMGTNVFFGQVSFITQTVSPILQLAVSLDYAIFLLHSFRDYRRDHEPEKAMVLAVKKAFSAVTASAATTVIGFLALMFMRFGVGPDLGINLVKGVALSFLSVMTFLPALTLACCRLLDKTSHKSFVPGFKPVGRLLTRISAPFLIAAVLIALPCYMAQSKTGFLYGMDTSAAQSRAGTDKEAIDAAFGNENVMVLLVPKGDAGRELELSRELEELPRVRRVVSYATAVGSAIPTEYLSAETLRPFYSENYARMLIYSHMTNEGPEAFSTVEAVRQMAGSYYEGSLLAGQSPTLYDMKNTVSADTKVVSLAAIIGILLVLFFTYRTPILPFLLVFTIETAIWLNLSFAYFSGQSFNFIGYLVISTVQLGATVDYAILLTDRYLENRKSLGKKDAMRETMSRNLVAVLTSAAILSTAGFTLAASSSNRIVSELGTLLGRGTVLSFAMVALVLPSMLIMFDRAIHKMRLRLFEKTQNLSEGILNEKDIVHHRSPDTGGSASGGHHPARLSGRGFKNRKKRGGLRHS